jgi:hypothetical protein
MQSSAVISPCGKYRYRLERRWGDGPALGFLLLNPSTADAVDDDPTLTFCIGIAKALGFSALVIGNPFAWRNVERETLLQTDDPVGPDNELFLKKLAADCPTVIAGWGPWPESKVWLRNHVRASRLFFPELKALALTNSGAPRHPLYFPFKKGVELVDYYRREG